MVPEEWMDGKVSDVVQALLSGVSVNGEDREKLPSEKGVLKVSAVSYGYFDETAYKVINETELERARTHPKIGQIIISRSNTDKFVGASAYIDRDYNDLFLPDKLWQTLPYAESNMKWLSFVLASEKSRYSLSKLATGTSGSMKNITKGELLSLRILIPPSEEQTEIAQILSTWDKAIETTEKLIENSKAQKKALMQQLLTGKKRLPGFDSQWKEIRIGDCVRCLDNKRIPLNSEQRAQMQGDVPYYGANGVLDHVADYIFDETLVLLAEDGGYFDEFSTRPIAQFIEGKAWVNNHAHILRAHSNATTEWIYFSLVHKNILGFINGGTRAKLNKSDMLMIPILLPSLEEQKQVCNTLGAAVGEIEITQQIRDCLIQEKKALMQQLLTGKRRVKLDGSIKKTAEITS